MGLVLNRVKLHRMLAMNVFCGPFFDCPGYKKRDLCALLVMLFCMLLGPVSFANAQELTVNEQYDAAFLEMYEDVGNLDLSLIHI